MSCRLSLIRRAQFCAGVFISSVLTIMPASADTFEWIDPISNVYSVFTNWNNLSGLAIGPPGVGDTALFNEAGPSYIVSFTPGASSDEFDVSTGDVTFQSAGGPFTYDVTSGLGDARVDGGNLTLGTSGAPLHLDTDTLRVRNGSQLNVLFGSDVDVANQLRIGADSSGDGTMIVSGNGSLLTTSAANVAVIGSSGSTGTLTLSSGADANIGAALHIAASNVDGTGGTVNLSGSGSSMTVAGDLNMVTDDDKDNQTGALNIGGSFSPSFTIDGNVNVGTGTGTNQSATITVDSSSFSAFRQNGATNFTIGGSGASNTALFDLDDGAVTTGTGQVTINHSGTLDITGGRFTANGAMTMTSGSTVTLNGGTLDAAAGLDNSAGGSLDHIDGRLEITNGAFVPGGFSYMIDGDSSPSSPHLVIGAGSTLDLSSSGSLNVGRFNNGTLTIENGGAVNAGFSDITIGDFLSSVGEVTVDGTGSSLTNTGFFNSFYVGRSGQGTLNVRNGGLVAVGSSTIGAFSGSLGVATVDGAGSTWTSDDDMFVRNMGELIVQNLGLVDVGDRLFINGGGTVTLDGGSIVTNTLENDNGGTFDFIAGSLTITSGIEIGTGTAFLQSVSLSSDQVLVTPGTTTIAPFRSVALNGGTLETNGLVINGTLEFNSGTLRITDAGGLTVGAAGPFGASLSIGAGQTLDVTNTLTVDAGATLALTTGGNISAGAVSNSGQLSGNGTLAGPLTNNAGGEVQALAGNNLVLTASGNTNNGQVTLSGGQVHFTQDFTNSAAGLVIGNGTLRADGGTSNDGDMAFSATANVIGDVTNNAGGTIISAGGTTTFFDDVTNNGEIRTNENSFTVYFGDHTGNGDTGIGTVIMEGDLKPGSSPGTMAFGGDLSFGPAASLEIEIGGLLAGSEYDRVTVADFASLDGTLDVSLINGFVPEIGNSFGFLFASGGYAGIFDTLNLPDIGPGKEWLLNPGGSTVFLEVRAAFSADFDLDGDVDSDDLAQWEGDFGGAGSDADGDGDSDGADFLAWQQQFGSGVLPLAASQAVPEPCTLLLLLPGCLIRPGRLARGVRSQLGRVENP